MNYKSILRNILIWPETSVICSQTLYETLLAIIDIYELTKKAVYLEQIKNVSSLIVKNQNRDGGFNIGYNFNFGTRLIKNNNNESTAPEMLSLYALIRANEYLKSDKINSAVSYGVHWIEKHSIKISAEKYGIPYAPNTLNDVHIINASSFCLPALAYYAKNNKKDDRIKLLFNRYINFLYDELETNCFSDGKYWRYFYRGGKRFENEIQKDKIDNYHLGQQLKYHCVIQKIIPTNKNLKIIKHLSDYLLSIRNTHGIYEYCNSHSFKPNNIHIWSFSSAIQGFVDAYSIIKDEKLLESAVTIKKWIIKNSWNGKYFIPVLDLNGNVLDNNYYPRTNAWTIHSMTQYMQYYGIEEDLLQIVEKVYSDLSNNSFIGKEKHVWTKRLVYATRSYHWLKGKPQII
jgi:hypothetical protein